MNPPYNKQIWTDPSSLFEPSFTVVYIAAIGAIDILVKTKTKTLVTNIDCQISTSISYHNYWVQVTNTQNALANG